MAAPVQADVIPGTSSVSKETSGIFVQASSVGDQAAAHDSLGFRLYVEALADFLIAPNTRPPLTLSIEGSWGSGKSSFMLQLKNRLKAVSPDSRNIDFNAWKYDKQEELWAAFALNLARSLRAQTEWRKRFWGDLKLYFIRIKGWSEAIKLICFAAAWMLVFGCLAVSVIALLNANPQHRASLIKQVLELGEKSEARPAEHAQATAPAPVTSARDAALRDLSSREPSAANRAAQNRTSSANSIAATQKVLAAPTSPAAAPSAAVVPPPVENTTPKPVHYWLANSSLATGIVLIIGLIWKIPDSFRNRLFSTQIEQYIDKPDYKGKAAFLDTFSADFAKTVQAYSGKQSSKIFVFIDDLDRCEAPKAADLMQAINLMIGDGNSLIFILGLDRAKVTAAIAFKYREMIPYIRPTSATLPDPVAIRDFGDTFLEKFIQLSFRLPISSNEEQARKFIDSLMQQTTVPALASTGQARFAQQFDQEYEAPPIPDRDALRIESGPESRRIRDIVMMVREVLDYSPRRVKTFLNSLRLSLYIASAQGLLDIDHYSKAAEVTPERLGKFLALTSRYPELQTIAIEDRKFLGDLETYVLTGRSDSLTGRSDSKAVFDPWLKKPGIRKLLAFGSEAAASPLWTRTYSLADFPAWKFESILPSVPPPEQIPVPPPQVPVAAAAPAKARPVRNTQKKIAINPKKVPADVAKTSVAAAPTSASRVSATPVFNSPAATIADVPAPVVLQERPTDRLPERPSTVAPVPDNNPDPYSSAASSIASSAYIQKPGTAQVQRSKNGSTHQAQNGSSQPRRNAKPGPHNSADENLPA